jgi:hypothetical protein
MILISTIWYFYASLILYKYRLIKVNSSLYHCVKSFSKPTFRLPEASTSDYLLPLKIIKRIVSGLFSRDKNHTTLSDKSKTVIFDSGLNSAQIRYEYVKHFTKEDVKFIVGKDKLLNFQSIVSVFYTLVVLIFFSVPTIIFAFFSKDKRYYALILQELIECINLQLLLKKHEITYLHYFCIFERDANLTAYVLQKNLAMFVNKIPSEVPLYFHNQTIVANQVSFCFAYQQEEFKAYSNTMFVTKTELWAPELILLSPKKYFDTTQRIQFKPIFNIGFYSSGNWLRIKKGDVDLGDKADDSEFRLLESVIKCCNEFNLSLCIYLHPIEKKREIKTETKAYYNQFDLPKNTYINYEESSMSCFEKVDTGISLFSTIMFERLYFGFKTLIVPIGYTNFPISESSFLNICIPSIEKISEYILKNKDISAPQFFNQNRIQHLSNFN